MDSWDELPAEIVANVMKHLDRKDLKACRLWDKRTSHEATRALFHTLCFAPSMTSVNKICQIAQHQRLATLRFLDVSCRNLNDDIIAGMRKSYYEEIEASEDFLWVESGDGIPQLWERFTQLRDVVFTNGSCPGQKVDGFYRNGTLKAESELFRRTGVRLLDDRTSDFNRYFCLDLLRLAKYLKHLRPSVIEIPAVHHEDIFMGFSPEEDSVALLLSQTKRFKLTFGTRLFDWDENLTLEDYLMAKWRCPSTMLPKLETLWVGSASLPLERRGNEDTSGILEARGLDNYGVTTAMTKWFLRPAYLNLAKVTLERACVTLADFKGFIRRHKATLKSLSIKSMRIDGWEDADEVIPNSILRLVAFLHDETTLEHMSFEGTLFDHRAERVLRCGPGDTACLRYRVEEYVCRRAELPFKALRPYWKEVAGGQLIVSMDGGRYMNEAEENDFTEVILETDESWSIETREDPSKMDCI
ncbi:hypothetical protein H2200_006977 [Cladophialophora chaetospira]|uniref:F-box domain-containing protein n=1 Tax=Cladophialophora chaetospira TaxID=386627 RepID=A0AA38X9C6_9EURO|nr:hypothetical protein H2200_006977 [Cladophialophora chaetospira]